MAKVGRFIVDPKPGASGQVTLDSRNLLVDDDKGGFQGGRVTIDVTKFFGFGSERIFHVRPGQRPWQGCAGPADPRRRGG
jgi:hypothetical protein